MCVWQFILFVTMIIIVISIILLTKVSKEIFKIFSCALALFPSKSVHLPWALPLGGCLRSLGEAMRALIRDCGHSLSGVCR